MLKMPACPRTQSSGMTTHTPATTAEIAIQKRLVAASGAARMPCRRMLRREASVTASAPKARIVPATHAGRDSVKLHRAPLARLATVHPIAQRISRCEEPASSPASATAY